MNLVRRDTPPRRPCKRDNCDTSEVSLAKRVKSRDHGAEIFRRNIPFHPFPPFPRQTRIESIWKNIYFFLPFARVFSTDVLLISTVVVWEPFVRVLARRGSHGCGRFTEGLSRKKASHLECKFGKERKEEKEEQEIEGTIRCASMNWETKQFRPGHNGLIQFRFCRISKRNSVYGGAALCVIRVCMCVCAMLDEGSCCRDRNWRDKSD